MSQRALVPVGTSPEVVSKMLRAASTFLDEAGLPVPAMAFTSSGQFAVEVPAEARDIPNYEDLVTLAIFAARVKYLGVDPL